MFESSLEVSWLDEDGAAGTLNLEYVLPPSVDPDLIGERVAQKLRDVQALIEDGEEF